MNKRNETNNEWQFVELNLNFFLFADLCWHKLRLFCILFCLEMPEREERRDNRDDNVHEIRSIGEFNSLALV